MLWQRDLGEFNQSQTQLHELYRQGLSGCLKEFIAYRILYFLYSETQSDLLKLMAELTSEQRQESAIAHALRVRKAVSTNNYHAFFRAYTTAPNMSGYLMDLFLERIRCQALTVLCRA